MAQGLKSKEEIVCESMNSPKKIDITVDFNIPRSTQLFDEKKHQYKCSCCGKGFTALKNNFQKSNSPLFQSNDGYLPWCKDCSDKYYSLLCATYSGNQEHAIAHFCQQVDWVYEENPLIAAREFESGHRDRSRLSHYAAKKNLNVGSRKTYIDTLKNNYINKQDEVITSKDDIKSDDVSVKASAIDRWGTGLTEWDYQILEDHYKMLKKNNPNIDNNQEVFVKSLCNINWLMVKMLRTENVDASKYTSLVEQYSKTFKQAGLKTIEEKDNSNSETVGVTLATISQFTPEEFYRDKKLFTDNDNIGDYYDRHICRPMRNLMFDQDVRDKEFFVPDGDIEDDD